MAYLNYAFKDIFVNLLFGSKEILSKLRGREVKCKKSGRGNFQSFFGRMDSFFPYSYDQDHERLTAIPCRIPDCSRPEGRFSERRQDRRGCLPGG